MIPRWLRRLFDPRKLRRTRGPEGGIAERTTFTDILRDSTDDSTRAIR